MIIYLGPNANALCLRLLYKEEQRNEKEIFSSVNGHDYGN